jgi:acetyltransferase-like isoleucine patch superfamily enzyme
MFEKLDVENFEIGCNPIIGKNVRITSSTGGRAKNITIGDNCFIGDDVQIRCDNFSIGDYAKIHYGTNFHGANICKIGHNFWIGQNSIVDSTGGTYIGNNCGVGASSQLWSHIRYGDVLEGCRFHTIKKLEIGNDCWFVGHCIVSPVKAHDKSMAMVGSVVTKDMEKNVVYAGVPAKPVLSLGSQFEDVSMETKFTKMISLYNDFGAPKNIKIVMTEEEIEDLNVSYFVIQDRSYTKRLTKEEISFMKFLLSDVKFIPYEENINEIVTEDIFDKDNMDDIYPGWRVGAEVE